MLKTYLKTCRIAEFAAGVGLLSAVVLTALPSRQATETYIVQGASLAGVKTAVESVGGEITHDLSVIRAVGAELNESQVSRLRSHAEQLNVFSNRSIRTASVAEGGVIADVARTVDANLLRSHGINGSGIAIAFLDTGIEPMEGISPTRTRDVTYLSA